MSVVGITGASGFLGRELCRAFSEAGDRVIAFVRQPDTAPPGAAEARRYVLGDVPDLAGVSALVHCAFVAGRVGSSEIVSLNVGGTLRLFEAARSRGIALTFISSVNAEPAVTSAYARQKRAIEESAGDATIIRPGLIVGSGGVFERLRKVAAARVVPLVDGGWQPVQLVAVRDVCDAVRVAMANGLHGRHVVVAEPAIPFREVVRRLANRPSGPVFVPVPFAAAYAAAAIAEALHVSLPVTTENLRGLRGTTVQPASQALLRHGWRPENALAVLTRSASKRTR